MEGFFRVYKGKGKKCEFWSRVFLKFLFLHLFLSLSLSRERTLEEEEEAVSLDDAVIRDERG